MKNRLKKNYLPSMMLACGLGLASVAQAGGTINFGEDKWVSLGFGLRTAFSSTEDAAPNEHSRSKDFDLDIARIYLSASLNQYIKGTVTLDKMGEDSLRVIDAYGQFEFMPEFNIWVGLLLPPSDRVNMDGHFFMNGWSFPGVVSQYQNKQTGRDNGILFWGKLLDKRLVYSAGIYEGNQASAFAGNNALDPNRRDNLMYAARLQYDFWEHDLDPGFYTSSVYFGKDVLSLGVSGRYQKDAVGNVSAKDDYLGYNVDFLLEKVLPGGVLDIEAAAYRYDFDNEAVLAGTDINGASRVQAGKAYLGVVSWMFPQTVGWGKFQPYTRYQKFAADGNASLDVREYDIGLNYVIDGHNARISGVYTKNKTENQDSYDKFVVGLQLQF